MNKLLLIIVILISNFTTAQITKAGNFYELDKLCKRDSVSVKQLLDRFDLDISKLKPFSFFKDLPFICFDVMEDKSGKLYVIESNSQPGVPFDATIQIYRQIFKDFYGKDVKDLILGLDGDTE